jgi:uncharacterized protein (DUF58 family)
VIARATPLAFALATLLGLTLFLGVLADRVELFIAAIPLALGLLSIASPVHPAGLTVRHQVSANRVAEGDRLLITLTITATEPVPMVEILEALPPLVEVDRGSNRVVLAVDPARETCWSFDVICPARGRFDLGTLYIRTWDRAGLSVVETRRGIPEPISVYPFAERVRQVPRPTRTQHSFGNYVSPRMGEGIEPGEIRPFLPGDRTRHINWRASLRRQQLYVTQFHEERNADVVLLLDTLCDIGAPPYSTLDLSVRAGATLANAYLTRKDRVGFVEFGPFLRWIDPATGRRQGEVLADGLLPAATYFSYVVPQLDRLPMRVLPRGALVVAISPLLDERFVKAVIDLAARGFDVVVLAVSPIEPTRRIVSASMLDDIACRLWAMEWRVRLDELRGRGLAIVEWHPDTLLETVLAPLSGPRPRRAAQR